MIKIIIFDFDGVFVKSNKLKTFAFKKIYNDLGLKKNKLRYIENYHLKNLGLSRYIKFKHFHQKFFDKNLNKLNLQRLSNKFNQIIYKKIITLKPSNGLKEFIILHSKKYSLYISTGTPEKEIVKTLKAFKIIRYFKKVYGSPLSKDIHIQKIISKENVLRKEMLFVGDSKLDYYAARKNKINFFLFKNNENKKMVFKKNIFSISNFINFKKKLVKYD